MMLCAAMTLTSCGIPVTSSGYGPVVGAGLKKPSEVHPNAKAFASQQVSLDQALDTPESRADGGRAILAAIKDLPPKGK